MQHSCSGGESAEENWLDNSPSREVQREVEDLESVGVDNNIGFPVNRNKESLRQNKKAAAQEYSQVID